MSFFLDFSCSPLNLFRFPKILASMFPNFIFLLYAQDVYDFLTCFFRLFFLYIGCWPGCCFGICWSTLDNCYIYSGRGYDSHIYNHKENVPYSTSCVESSSYSFDAGNSRLHCFPSRVRSSLYTNI